MQLSCKVSNTGWKWYVYELCDPDTEVAFYVGKGSGSRMYSHERESAKGVSSKKCNKIRSLIESKGRIHLRQVAFFKDEQDAYDFETDCIASYGLKNLTNIMPGGQVAFERRHVERKERADQAPMSMTQVMRNPVYDRIYTHMAWWFKHGLHDREYEIKVTCPTRPFTEAVMEVMYNSFFPKLWEQIKGDPTLFDILKRKMQKYSITFEYAGP